MTIHTVHSKWCTSGSVTTQVHLFAAYYPDTEMSFSLSSFYASFVTEKIIGPYFPSFCLSKLWGKKTQVVVHARASEGIFYIILHLTKQPFPR